MVINRLAKQIDDVLFASSAVDRTNIFLREHASLFIRAFLLLSNEHIVHIFDLNKNSKEGGVTPFEWLKFSEAYLFLKGLETLAECLFVREHAA